MHKHILNELNTKELISETQSERIDSYETNKPFSLHWELKTLLYLGIILVNLGLGWLIYDNIDSIGHGVVIGGIATICVACFAYTYRNRTPFSWQQTESASPYYDYVLLLGCLMFVILEGYLQYQYEIFGTRYGLTAFIPMTFFFGIAYLFDHRGALSLAITALASWLGIAVTPADILNNNDFGDSKIVWTGVLLGIILCALAFFSEQQDRKKHFAFTYLNFGIHILFIACLSGLMILEIWVIFLPLLILTTVFFIWYSRNRTSLYFMVVALIYSYITLTYLVFQIDWDYTMHDGPVYFYTFYFMSSCAAIIVFLLKYKTILRIKNIEQ